MEGNEVNSKPSKQADFCEWLEQLCEYYMAMGVSFDEFWYGDYCKLKFYEKKHSHDLERRNYNAWLQGALFYRAIEVALARGFGGDRNAKYPTYNEFVGRDPVEEMSQEELWAYIQSQLEEDARSYQPKQE